MCYLNTAVHVDDTAAINTFSIKHNRCRALQEYVESFVLEFGECSFAFYVVAMIKELLSQV